MIEVKNATLGWTLRHDSITFDSVEPYVTVNLIPKFPFCSADISDDTVVWDLEYLIHSVKQPGACQILNCTCSCADCAGIEDLVYVSHPDDDTVIWEMDIPSFKVALDNTLNDETFIRLVFHRESYEASIRAMLREVQAAIRTPYPVEAFPDDRQESLSKEYPGIEQVPVDGYEPDYGYDHFERIAALDLDEPWPRQPLFPEGTHIDIGLFGQELYLVNDSAQRSWITYMITRWEARCAFERWMDTVTRRYALEPRFAGFLGPSCVSISDAIDHKGNPDAPDPNAFIPMPDMDESLCHRAGDTFAREMARCFSEGATAPGVIVRYVADLKAC
jgi:hypothetical protein